MFFFFQILPVVFGIAAVLTVAVAARYYFSKVSKGDKKKPRTLLDSTKKVMLPLIEKEELSHDTKRECLL